MRFKGEPPPGLRQNQRVSVRIVMDSATACSRSSAAASTKPAAAPSPTWCADDTAERAPIETGAASVREVEITERPRRGRPDRRSPTPTDSRTRRACCSRTDATPTRRGTPCPCSKCARSPRSTAPTCSRRTRCANSASRSRGGEFVAVTGPSGSGKTTFLNVAGLLETFDSGSYRLDGEDVSRLGDDAALARPQPEDRLHLPELQPDPGPRTSSTTSTCRCATGACRPPSAASASRRARARRPRPRA